MTKEQILDTLRLLSALEAWSFAEGRILPGYLFERLDKSIKVLTSKVLE